MEYEELDAPKYKKKKLSNTSKSRAKTNHKHDKKLCLFINKNSPYLGCYCTICGKIHNWKRPTEKIESGCYRMLKDEEVFEQYKNLEQIHLENLWQKYVSITKGGN